MKNDQMEFGGGFTRELLARQQWVSACQFHNLEEEEVLREVARRAALQARSVVLLDLDSTLYEVGPRTYQILIEWAQSKHEGRYAASQYAILQLEKEKIKYSVRETFAHLREVCALLDEPGALESAERFWFERFFTNKYLPLDRPYAGAAEFAQNLHRLGAEIIYLTGRDEPNMGDGTRANLIRDGFPWNLTRTHLLMKPSFYDADLDHKKAAADYVRRQGSLVASFENEPPNLVALSEIFPEAMHVFVDTVCSELGAKPGKDFYRISRFRFSP